MNISKKINQVMLIDDSKSVNSRNESLLKDMEYFSEVISFTSSDKAIDYLKKDLKGKTESLPELIFLDISMPDKDGFDFLDKYIQLDIIVESDYSPIVTVVSDYLLEAENFEKSKYYKSYGVLGHLLKPMDKQDIEELMEEYFGNS